MPLQLKEFTAWIDIGGVELQQYCVDISEDGEAVSCWIASQVGKNFSVNWKSTPPCCYDTSGRVTVDGIKCGDRVMRRGDGNLTKRSHVTTSSTTRRALLFSSLQLTDDDSVDDENAKNIGSISVLIWRVKLGNMGVAESIQLPGDERVHERSKKAIAHRVGFGEEKKTNKIIHHQKVTRIDTKPIVTFTFKYRPYELLQANGIIPAPVGKKRRVVESPEPAVKAEDEDVEAKEIKLLEEKLEAMREKEIKLLEEKLEVLREKRSLRMGSCAKKVKTEVKTENKAVSIPGEVIDLT